MKRRVVVTGLGVVTALGRAVETFWDRILRGESGVGPITLFDVSGFRVQFGGEVPWNAEAENIANSKELRRLDRFTQFAMAAAADAVSDSGLDFSKEDPYRCGVVIGSGIGGLSEFECQHERLLHKGVDKVSPFTIPKLMVNSGSGHVSSMYGIKGPNFAVATACASAANSIGDALRAIQYGDADIMVTGGSEAAITPMGLAGFQNMRALSFRSDAPQQASRPFDMHRDGFVLAEGGAVVVLEELESAISRGATIYAELIGYGLSADAYHITSPAPGGEGAGRAIKMALKTAGIAPSDVDYVNAHGTSTHAGDIAETQAIKSVFGDHAYKLAVSSSKSQMGHLVGAAGAIEAVICVLAINNQLLPPTINLHTPDPACDLDYVPNQARPGKIDIAVSNSFGFGGHNISLILAA